MYMVYTITLLILVLILGLTLKEEIMVRKGITHGMANKYWAVREKRKFVRFQEDMKIRYNRINSTSSRNNTKMRNISTKGLCISTYEKLEKKDMLDLEIEVPGFSKPVRLTIIWLSPLQKN